LWWIIPTVVIGLCLVGVVYLVSRRINSSTSSHRTALGAGNYTEETPEAMEQLFASLPDMAAAPAAAAAAAAEAAAEAEAAIEAAKIVKYYLGLSREEQGKFGDKLNSSGVHHYVDNHHGKKYPKLRYIYEPYSYNRSGVSFMRGDDLIEIDMRGDDLIHINVIKEQFSKALGAE
jgi:hypothetical protein